MSLDFKLVAASESIYRRLLLAYPPCFRAAYGPHMVQVFRDCCRATAEQRGPSGLVMLWLPTLLELVATAIVERLEEGFSVSKSTFIRWSGPAAMLGGLMWAVASILIAQLPPGIPDGPYRETNGLDRIVFVGALLVGCGILGLWARYMNDLGSIGAAGVGISGVALACIVLFGVLAWLPLDLPEVSWFLFIIPVLVLLIVMVAGLGVALLRSGLAPQWLCWLLIAAGLLTFVFNFEDNRAWLGVPVGLAWVAIGYALWSGASERGAGPTRLA